MCKVRSFRPERLLLACIFAVIASPMTSGVTTSLAASNAVSTVQAEELALSWGRFVGIDSVSRTVSSVTPAFGQYRDLAWIVSFEGGGFSVVPRVSLLMPVEIYAPTGFFDSTCPGYAVLFDEMQDRVQFVATKDTATARSFASQRSQLRSSATDKSANVILVVYGPLGTSNWDQGAPFNRLCPGRGSCAAGCVAIAMAQTMYYWKYPVTGVDAHSYTTSTQGWDLGADFGNTTYDWSSMTDVVGTNSSPRAITAVATLCYHCGVAVDMDYCQDASGQSGANTFDVPGAMRTHFGYRDGATARSANISQIIEELSFMRPVIVRGTSPSGGHAWVVDGYGISNSAAILHMRMGWFGQNDLWRTVDDIPGALEYEHHILYTSPPNVFYCANYGGCTSGRPDCPYSGFSTAVEKIPPNQTLILQAGSSFAGAYVINKPMSIKGRVVTIGR